ncbi:TetR/AcrR family transcriptional regulator [Sinosporangium siamense]|uniref:TetR family transcriptional regulator n=1 Tax=Sinosporangium siamense TaxID=1367973 RepID=A0A919RN28_9ACTN|nr:TetR/AcrR family transcriptional regulator [Sinosporangium siamense]GII96207.1 TetR family transcriptional regulator [Sinosporangium siamense]
MTGSRRRPRADAQRNRDRILAEAEAVFREQGVGASLEGVARGAGVAIGTLYAHFPTRRALVGALLRERNAALFARGEELLGHPSPAEALTTWVHTIVAHAAAYGGLAGLLAKGADDEASELHQSCVRMTEIGEMLLDRAKSAGALRGDTTGGDVFALMNAAAWVSEQISKEQAGRLVDLTLGGMLTADAPA